MRKNKLLLLASSIGVFVVLAAAAIDENFLKQWRRIQGSARNQRQVSEPHRAGRLMPRGVRRLFSWCRSIGRSI